MLLSLLNVTDSMICAFCDCDPGVLHLGLTGGNGFLFSAIIFSFGFSILFFFIIIHFHFYRSWISVVSKFLIIGMSLHIEAGLIPAHPFAVWMMKGLAALWVT